MHRLKTGALLQGSVEMGAACGAPIGADALAALRDYGAALGLAFQVVDDILDVTADSATLGKTAGKDAASDKPTYVSLLGLDGARAQAQRTAGRGARRARRAARLPDTARAARAGRHGRRPRPITKTTPWLRCSHPSTIPPVAAPARPRAAQAAGRRGARLRARQRVAHRRPPELQPRHGRTHGRAAPRLQHAARPAGVGRGPPDLSAQDPHRPARAHAHAAPAGRHLGLSAARRKRVRHLRHRAFVHQHLGRARHGDGRQAEGRGPPCGRDHRRRRADRRHGLRGAQQRRRRATASCW